MADFSRKSKWTYDTSASAGAGASDGPLGGSVEAGFIALYSPQNIRRRFFYASVSAGAGLSAGVKVGGSSVGGSIAPAQLPSEGDVFIADGINGELKDSDFEGFCTVLQLSGGVGLAGKSLTTMAMGIPQSVIPQEMFRTSPVGMFLSWVSDHLEPDPGARVMGVPVEVFFKGVDALVKTHAKALVVMSGTTVGQLGGGISSGIGYVSAQEIPSLAQVVEMVSPNAMRVTVTDRLVTVVMNGNYLFDFGKSEIAARAQYLLHRIESNALARMPDRIIVECHEYSYGPGKNRSLSQLRADAIAFRLGYWVYSSKINPITAIGFGDTEPASQDVIYGVNFDKTLIPRVVIRLEYTPYRETFGPQGPSWHALEFEFQSTDWPVQ